MISDFVLGVNYISGSVFLLSVYLFAIDRIPPKLILYLAIFAAVTGIANMVLYLHKSEKNNDPSNN